MPEMKNWITFSSLFLPVRGPPRPLPGQCWSAGPPCPLLCPQGSFQEQIWPATRKRVLRGRGATPGVYALSCITGGACTRAHCAHPHCAHRQRRTRASPAAHAHAHHLRFMRTRAAHAHAHRRRFMCTRAAPITDGACVRARAYRQRRTRTLIAVGSCARVRRTRTLIAGGSCAHVRRPSPAAHATDISLLEAALMALSP